MSMSARNEKVTVLGECFDFLTLSDMRPNFSVWKARQSALPRGNTLP
jgi:hypothetical protein